MQKPISASVVTSRDESAIRLGIRERIASLAGAVATKIELGTSFRNLGLDSAQITSRTDQLSKWLGRNIALIPAWHHLTPAELARHVMDLAPKGDPPAAVKQDNRWSVAAILEPIAVVRLIKHRPACSSVELAWAVHG